LQQSTVNVKTGGVSEVVPDAHESQNQQIWVFPITPALQEMTTKDRTLAAIVLWINQLPICLYQ
jgi:hypothetical protein